MSTATLIAASIHDLTDQQILDLNDEQTELLIQRRMAEEGIPVLPMPIEPEYLPVDGPDVAIHEIAGVSFRDRNAAEAVLHAINEQASHRVKLGYGPDYRVRFIEADDSQDSVTTRMHYSQETYAREQDAIAENEKRRNRYNTAMAEYRKTQESARHIRDEINERISEVVERRQRMEMLAERFAEYKVLAQGDEAMAMDFLARAYEVSAAEAAELRSEAVSS